LEKALVTTLQDWGSSLITHDPSGEGKLGLSGDYSSAFKMRCACRQGLSVVLSFFLGITLCAVAPQTLATDAGGSGDASPTAADRPAGPAPIPLEQIAPRATEVAQLLRTVAANRIPGPEIDWIRRSLPDASADLAQAKLETSRLLDEHPSLETLQDQEQRWQRRQHRFRVWLDVATERAARLQQDMDRLAGAQAIWALTRDHASGAATPQPLLGQIDTVLGAVETARPPTEAARDHILDLQAGIAQAVGDCESVRARIAELQRTSVGRLLSRDGHPIWRPGSWPQAKAVMAVRLPQLLASYGKDAWLYVTDPTKHLPIHLAIFILALSGLVAGRRQVDRWEEQGQSVARLVPVFDRPVAAASLVALLAVTTVPSPVPFTVKQLASALALLPMVLLTRPVVNPRLMPALYALAVLFALDTLRHAFGGVPPLLGQSIILVQSLAGAAVLLPLLKPRHHQKGEQGKATLGRLLVGLILVVLAAGFVGSLLGYLRLARLTAPAVLVGAFDALALAAAVEVAMAVAAFAFRAWPLRRFRMVQHHRELIEARIHRALVVLAFLGWWARYLSYLGLWEPALASIEQMLVIRFQMGSFDISVGAVLAFLATLLVAFVLSSIVRFVLAEEIYPRAGFPSGTAYAASSLIHYSILSLAFVLALGLLGVSLTQVTVLAGALGVGIGFGLQGIVHNFVSGLILLLERPIQVGDAVQVGSLQGWVRRIGIRASVVRTVQGAEIIVPNSQLTSEQVTNWTHSDQQRRIDLPVGLSYGAPPGRIIELLEGVARAHPRVLASPPPQCLFMSYGDSSINFELRVWTDFAIWIQVQSELTVAVYDAVYAAGLTFPFPQREVRLLSDPVSGPDGPGGETGKAAPD